MFRSRSAFPFLLLAGMSLGGCEGFDSAAGWSNRYGPDPTIPADLVAKSTNNQIGIWQALYSVSHDSAGHVDNYTLTLAGFNFVDEQCDAYLRELFIIDQERDRVRKGIDAAGLVTNAVLAATPTSKVAMAIVAQSFGLSSQFVDTAANSYLFGAHASTVLNIVSKLQNAYRDQAEKDKAKISSEPAAYAEVRGYLQLCMPPTIQAKIEEALASSVASSGKVASASPTGGPGSTKSTSLQAP